ncbi:MAG: hypothetical protein AB7N76_23495 [Planctomycetota bacterium]
MKICPACRFDRCDDTSTRCRQCGADLTVEDEEEEEYHPNLAAAWFHYLQIPQIGTVELVPGKAFIVGKGVRNDLRLTKCPDEEAARIFWTDDYDEAQVIPSKGAQWATKVDNIRLSAPRTLKGGEEVEVGQVVLKYLKKATPVEGATRLKRRSSRPAPGQSFEGPGTRKVGDLNKAAALEPNQRTLSKPAPASPPAGRAGRGDRATARPADVAKAIESTKAFGTLRISGAQGRGWVTVRGGVPQHAAFGERGGRAALDAILRLGPCRCYLDSGIPKLTKGEPLNVTFSAAAAALAARAGGPARPAPGGARPGGPARPGPAPGRPGQGGPRPGGPGPRPGGSGPRPGGPRR